jgi:hypothetical protein
MSLNFEIWCITYIWIVKNILVHSKNDEIHLTDEQEKKDCGFF